MLKTRSTSQCDATYILNGVVHRYPLPQWEYESMLTYKKPSPCRHWFIQPVTGFWGVFSGGEHWMVYEYQLMDINQLLSLASPILTAHQFSLNRNKLKTTNRFGLVEFVAELDQSIALFIKNSWRNWTYGSFKWGVLPMVNEMKKLLKFLTSAKDSFGPMQRYEDQQVQDFEGDWYTSGGGRLKIVGKVTTRYSGRIIFPLASEAQKWLDRLGFHPDINVAWDLIPLSFMVDWFLPVGTYINSLYASGWIRQVKFEGWQTTKVEGTITLVGNTFASRQPDPLTSKFKLFDRVQVEHELILKTRLAPDLEVLKSHWYTDSDGTVKDWGLLVTQLFDTWFLNQTQKGKSKGISKLVKRKR